MRSRPEDDLASARRRVPRRPLVLALLALAGLLHPGAAGAAASDAPARPNIVLLVAEDLGPRIGAFGDSVARTPHIDALAAQGVRFPNTFTTAGVCAPSRAALITGRHAIAIGAQHMRTSSRPQGAYQAVPPADVKAFPEHLRAAGYHTSVTAKLDYQFSGPLLESGPFTIWDVEGGEQGWRERDPGQPFFAMHNFGETHESGLFPPLGNWPNSFVHFVMQVLRATMIGRTPASAMPDPALVSVPPYYPDTETVRRDIARQYANVTVMDERVGRVIADLEADGLLEDTIVVWTTDHGDGLPRAKRELFDSGLRVPMIVRWPEHLRPAGATPGSVDSRLVSFVDLAPTILAWAGAPLPPGLHGQPFDTSAAPRRYVYAARDRIDEVPDRQRAVRDSRFKYIRSWAPEIPGGHPLEFRDNLEMMRELRSLHDEGRLDEIQARWFEPFGPERLFDTAGDPHEVHDLALQPEYAPVLERMRAALDDWTARIGDWSAAPEGEMVERMWPGGEPPTTATPSFSTASSGEDGTLRAKIDCSSEGASIGVRRGSGGPWKLYTAPIAVEPGEHLQAKAIRYGWQESSEASFTVPSGTSD